MIHKIELTEKDFQLLLIAMGHAIGSALRHSDNGLAYEFLRLTNTINRDNPEWIPYAIPEEQPHAR